MGVGYTFVKGQLPLLRFYMQAHFRCLHHRQRVARQDLQSRLVRRLSRHQVRAKLVQLKAVFGHGSRVFAALERVILGVNVSTHDHRARHIFGAGNFYRATLLQPWTNGAEELFFMRLAPRNLLNLTAFPLGALDFRQC